METEKEEIVKTTDDEGQDHFFEDQIDDDDDDEQEVLTDEQKAAEALRKKNKDAEEARKRREAQAKIDADKAAATAKELADKAKLAEEEAKKKEEADKNKVQEGGKEAKLKELGSQLAEFKTKYPDIDLKSLDNDADFKEYVDGKLLGKKNFTTLYESYVAYRGRVSGQSADDIRKNHEKKAQSGSGSSSSRGSGIPSDIFSPEELKEIAEKLPKMHSKKVAEISAKLEKSIAYYDKK